MQLILTEKSKVDCRPLVLQQIDAKDMSDFYFAFGILPIIKGSKTAVNDGNTAIVTQVSVTASQ